MKPEKIDYERMGNNFIVDDGGINRALIKVFAQIYIVNRHGVYKRYLSRSAAINKLAQVMQPMFISVLDCLSVKMMFMTLSARHGFAVTYFINTSNVENGQSATFYGY
ncbi:hypothetical protein ACNVFB_004233 [Yersinia enterocolitica]